MRGVRRFLPAGIGLCLLFAMGLPRATGQSQPGTQVGVAPVYDEGSDPFGPVFAQHLTVMLYEDLALKNGVSARLINPGGAYAPGDDNWLGDYLQDQPDVGSVLITTLKPMEHGPRNALGMKRYTIHIETALLDLASGKRMATWLATNYILVENAELNYTSMSGLPTRIFEKQPLGKGAAHLAEEVAADYMAYLASNGKAPKPTGSTTAAGGTCPVHVRVTYGYKHTASQVYSIFANGLDQSLGINEGVSSYTGEDGPQLLQISVQDAPYNMSKQAMYQLTPWLDCASGKRTYVVDLGKGGQANGRWEE